MALSPVDIKYFKLAVQEVGKETPLDVNARCIVCGDSHSNKNKKRLHLYTKASWENASVKCFNCEYSSTLRGFLKEFRPDLLNSYNHETGFGVLDSFKKSKFEESSVMKIDLSNTVIQKYKHPLPEPKMLFDIPKEFLKITDERSVKALEYLRSRNLSDEDIMKFYFCTGSIVLNSKEISLQNFIVLPLMFGDQCYGFYSRNIDTKFFYTYLPEENFGLKVWNLYDRVQSSRTLYIFESVMDAMSTSFDDANIMAVLGADMNKDLLHDLKSIYSKIVFVLDNDVTGRTKMIKHAKEGYHVFMYPLGTSYKDLNEMLKVQTREDNTRMILNGTAEGRYAVIRSML